MRMMLRWFFVLTAVLTATPALAGKIGFLDVEKAVSMVGESRDFLVPAAADAKLQAQAAADAEVLEATEQAQVEGPA